MTVLPFPRRGVYAEQPLPPRITARDMALASARFWTAYWLVPLLLMADVLDAVDRER